jgi:uncharacterized membrane protein
MMAVHFPAALLPMDLFFGIAALYFQNDSLYQSAYYCLMAGVIGGWIAVLTGLYDLFTRIIKPGQKIALRAWIHAGTQTTVTVSFSIALSLEYHTADYRNDVPIWMWVIKSFLLVLLMAGNYFGGELVFRHVAKEM